MEAAKHLKPCILELGGKGPAIVRIASASIPVKRWLTGLIATQVLEDADISEAARAIAYGAMAHSGQVWLLKSHSKKGVPISNL
jgi:acyl-CoA reductase-like NAD-dependent aldehyde dehydrogenase